MGKKGYNAKARQINKTSVDNSETKKITIEFESNEYGVANESNLLALPSQKRKTKVIKEKVEKTRILSKTQRKRLEKIVDKKKKKENRAALLEALSQVQVSNEELSKMTSITAVQTMGVRNLSELYLENKQPTQSIVAPPKYAKMSSIAGARKRKRLLLLDDSEVKRSKTNDPNVVGLDPESSGDEDSTEEEDVNDEIEDHEVVVIDDTTDVPKQANTPKAEELNNAKNSETLKNTEKSNNEKKDLKKIVRGKTSVLPDAKPSLKNDNKLVNLQRDPKIQVARLKLPILGEEQNIVEAINENEIVILAGETGSGKTTQVPQFLYEAGYATSKLIGITEPRRVATVAMAARVGFEMGLSSREISYLMRFEGNVTKETKIKFMTDGVLLKEVQTDFLLTRYSVIIIDEAHERSVYTDILIGLLSRIVPLRRKRGIPLRLIIMSATLRVEDFTENTRLFKSPPPVIKVESRQFPVTVHFNKKTHEDYLKEAYRKAVKIHTKLPDGGILIFVTGQQEVRSLVRKLKHSFPYRSDVNYAKQITKRPPVSDMSLESDSEDAQSDDDDEVEREMKRALRVRKKAKLQRKMLPKISLDDYGMPPDDGQADLVVSGNESDGHLDSDTDPESDNLAVSIKACRQPLWVLPLYSMLGAEGQARVFAPPPVGTRFCIVSTDVAETSLTIPGVKYVVDTGKKKTRLYDGTTGASAFRITWTSQAGASQRTGRAGRTAPGHCYRLYSSAVFQHELQKFATPDIQMKPIDELVLQMKCMGIDKVVNFPFPTAPDRMQLHMSEHRLKVLGILEVPLRKTPLRKDQEEVLKVTALGKAVSAFPVLPRYGKMLALSHQQNLLPYAVAMVSALSVPEVISGKGESWPATGQSLLLGDPGVLLRATGAAEFANSKHELELFCAKHGLREKAVKEIRKLRWQLTSEIKLSVAGVNLTVEADMKPPTEDQARLLRQLLLSGLGDQVAKKVAIEEVKEGEDKRKFKYAYHCGEMEEVIHLHSSSILRRTIPEWVVYQEIYEASGKLDGAPSKIIMRGATAIEPEWLPIYVPDLCNMGEPLTDPEPSYNPKTGRVHCHLNSTFGKAGWPLPVVEMSYPNKLGLYKWFGRFILEGTVCQKLKKYVPSLLSPPATMVKSWARLQPRTELFCKTLAGVQVGSRDGLVDMWRQNPKFLLHEYLKWLPESAHNEVTLMWPPLK